MDRTLDPHNYETDEEYADAYASDINRLMNLLEDDSDLVYEITAQPTGVLASLL